MADATVGVVWHPFEAPNAYVSPILAGGLTLPDGSFGFNIETDDALDQFKQDLEGRFEQEAGPVLEGLPLVGGLPDAYSLGASEPLINVEVHAVDSDHTWLAVWYLALSLDGTYEETITANMDLSTMPGAADLSSEALAGLQGNVTTCLPNDEPDGFDAMLLEIEDDADGAIGTGELPDELDPNRICAVSIDPTSPEPSSSADGYPAPTPDECTPAPYTCLAGTKTRWTKVAEMHSSPGMLHQFLYDKGRDTQTNIAIKSSNGGGWGLGGWAYEQSARNTWVSIPKFDNYHRERFMQYIFHKYRTCYYDFSGGYTCWDTWKPSFWGGGYKKRSKNPVWQPGRDTRHDVAIENGTTWTTANAQQWGFGIGVRLGPINLGSQAGFSEITQFSWTGRDGCGSTRWIWGANGKWPVEAPRIYAICEPNN